ncbi:MAG: hypothetical protein ABR987_13730 [Terracidiphilus sp.]|jgi:hypothetical protein
MDRNQQEMDAMGLSGAESILASEETIVPSSGFLDAVMERVKEEATMPAPIPFPWKRALPGFVVAGGLLGWGGVELVRIGVPALNGASLSVPHLSIAMNEPLMQAGWVALAAVISLASWLLARKLAGRPDAQ